MENCTEIKVVIGEYIKWMDKLIALENEKLAAILNKDMEQLNNFIKEEQVFLLQLRGLDQKREAAQEKCGVATLSYRQIIEKLDGSDKNEMELLYQTLSTKTKEFKKTISTIKSYIDVKLHIIDTVMEKLGGNFTSSPNIYSDSGAQLSNTKSQNGRFESTKV